MKYLKIFEDFSIASGDYVLVNMTGSNAKYESDDKPFLKGQIFQLIVTGPGPTDSKESSDRQISFFIKSTFGKIFYIHSKDLMRKLTPEEIENFEAETASYKYNL